MLSSRTSRTRADVLGPHACSTGSTARTLLEGEPEPGNAYLSRMTEPPAIAAAALAENPLLEREQELSALDGLLTSGGSGGSRLVLVEGTAGIGKSRLIAELREHARSRDMRVLAAHGSDLEREFPFGVVRQLFEPLLADASRADAPPDGCCGGRATGVRGGSLAGCRWRRRVVRRAARPVLADGQHRRRAAAAAGGGRPAVVRSAVTPVPGLPCAPPRRRERGAGGRPTYGRAGHGPGADR